MTQTFNLSSGEIVSVTIEPHIDRNIEVYIPGEVHLILTEKDVANMMSCWREAIAYFNGEDRCD